MDESKRHQNYFESPRKPLAVMEKNIATWNRNDLEDKFLRLYEDHIELKKSYKSLETNMKQQATKWMKLTDSNQNGDNKKDASGGVTYNQLRVDKSIMEANIGKLKQDNRLLKDKLKLMQEQQKLLNRSTARVNTGIPKKANIRTITPNGYEPLTPRDRVSISESVSPQMSPTSRSGMMNMKQHQQQQQFQLQLQQKQEQEYDFNQSKKWPIDDKKYIQLYEQQRTENQMLKDKNMSLQRELSLGQSNNETTSVYKQRIRELESISERLKEEMRILRETNDELTDKAFDRERERDWREKEIKYMTQIKQLEKTLKMDVGEKGGILDEFRRERDNYDKLEKDMSGIRLRNFELQQKCDDMDRKLKFYEREYNINPNEANEDIIISKQTRINQALPEQKLEVFSKEDMKKLQEEEARHAETIRELEKTRSLLRTQYKISNDYKMEAEKAAKRLDEVYNDCQSQLAESAKLLDIRAARIKKLESQLKDIGYGTKSGGKILMDEIPSNVDTNTLVQLERGENVIEIHIGRISLTDKVIQHLTQDSEPLLFGTWEFLHFEIQATGILRGISPDFDMTAEYIVKVDEFLLDCLYKKTFTFELHQAIGSEYETLGMCQLSCKDLLTDDASAKYRTAGGGGSLRLQCQSRLIGLPTSSSSPIPAAANMDGMQLGVLEYWIRLRHPMNEILRQYNEKVKAINYMNINTRADQESHKPATVDDGRLMHNVNELIIRVIECKSLQSTNVHLQPAPYFVYTFYDFPPYNSTTISSTNHPQFHDVRRFPVNMDSNLHKYLKTQHLKIVVIDELDTRDSGCLGYATIPLIGLSHNKKIQGTYSLISPESTNQDYSHVQNQHQATINVEIEWMNSYKYREYTGEQFTNDQEITNVHLDPSKIPRNLNNMDQQISDHIPVKDEPRPKVRHKTHKAQSTDEDDVEKSVKPRSSSLKPKTSVKEIDNIEIMNSEPIIQKTDIQNDELPKASVRKRKDEAELRKSLEEVRDLLITDDVPINKLDSPETDDVSEMMEMTEHDKTIRDGDDGVVAFGGATGSRGREGGGGDEVIGDDTSMSQSLSDQINSTIKNSDEIMMQIFSVHFEESVKHIVDKLISNDSSTYDFNDYFVYAGFLLPGIAQPDSESNSISIPVGRYPKHIDIGFRNTFDVSFDRQNLLRRHIATLITQPQRGNIEYQVCLEPKDSNVDVWEIAKAIISAKQLLNDGLDLDRTKLTLYSVDEPSLDVGYIEVSTQIVDVLRAIRNEIK